MNPDDRGSELAIVTGTFLGLSTVTVALRCYVRAYILRSFYIEDGLAVVTLCFFVFYCTIVLISTTHGSGKRIEDLSAEDTPKILKLRWLAEIIYIITSLFLKFTVGIFLFRICSRVWQKWVVCSVLVACLGYYIVYAFLSAFQCQPVAYFWFRYNGMKGKCWSSSLVMGSTYTAAGVNVVTDWVLGLLPIALVRNLELSRRSKILVSGTLALGSIASTATIVRIPYIWQLTQPGNYVHDFTDLSIWSTTENGIGLIASSVATLRPLIRLVLGTTRVGSVSRGNRSFNYSWRRSRGVPAHDENQQFYRMDNLYRHSTWKTVGRARDNYREEIPDSA
ncbi:hypothetical protein F5Y11DRAFT_361885 [Daldinia sp. FL1419]|nr:hypothetical protein F5Y11DRAFT_361885 [Daldinia sp. FL1419]